MPQLIPLIQLVFRFVFILIVARAVLSWFRPPRFNRTFYEIERFVHRFTEPILRPLRSFLPAAGGMDWSPFIAILILSVLERIIIGGLR